MIIGCGPFGLHPGESESIPFAFVAAKDLESLKQAAAQAISLWYTFGSKSDNPNISDFFLEQNFPNPFNSETHIRYILPSSDRASLKIYDILGREVADLVDQYQQSGLYDITFRGNGGMSSGVYFYKLETPAHTKIKKMIYLK